ncbi:MAG: PQQ-dependent sugar dehydrogenase [Conexibacter sp.]
MRRLVVLIGLTLLATAAASAPAAASGVRLVRVGSFEQPDDVAAPPGDAHRLFVVQRYGLIRVVRDGRVLKAPFADLRRQVLIRDPDEGLDQRGLFSIAFAPDYRRSGLLYAMYVDRRSHLRVDALRRSRRDPDRVDPHARRLLVDLGPAGLQHHGGQLQFGLDRRLWISTGQEDDPASSQDPHSWNGKLLRIDPRAPAARPEVMASGLRNPWRFSFDAPTRTVVIGDVGDSTVEEVDMLPLARLPGANLGWPHVEGNVRRSAGPRGVLPQIVHRHDDGWCSVVGGYVVRDPGLPALRGRYLYGDVCSGRLWSAKLTPAGAPDDRPLPLTAPYLVSFGRDGRGHLYAVSLAGDVWRLAAG